MGISLWHNCIALVCISTNCRIFARSFTQTYHSTSYCWLHHRIMPDCRTIAVFATLKQSSCQECSLRRTRISQKDVASTAIRISAQFKHHQKAPYTRFHLAYRAFASELHQPAYATSTRSSFIMFPADTLATRNARFHRAPTAFFRTLPFNNTNPAHKPYSGIQRLYAKRCVQSENLHENSCKTNCVFRIFVNTSV